MVSQKYRWDFIGLSTDEKPTSETSDKVVNGSTYYCSDTSKLYVYCDGTWYERKPLGGGGGGTSNFDQLTNRPKYNGSEMTSSTDIPEVKTYTAGSNISISAGNEISATDTKYIAGTNVSISDQNVISATDTTYSNFTGTDGTTAGTAGLVPAPATTDTGKFLKADGTWDTAGSAINVVQSTGTSTTSVMSQNAVTSMVFADPSKLSKVQIGSGASATGTYGVAIGEDTSASGVSGVAIGSTGNDGALASGGNSVALGRGKATALNSVAFPGGEASTKGVFQIGTNRSGWDTYGYNDSAYRLLTGLYDGQSAHDAATYGQVISYSAINGAGAPTTATEGKYVGQLYYDTTNEAMYFLKTIDTTTTPATYTWEALGGGSSVNVVQTTGTSTTDVMSQNAVTGMMFADPGSRARIQIGRSASAVPGSETSIAIGAAAVVYNSAYFGVAIGSNATAGGSQSVAIGRFSSTSQRGEFSIGGSSLNGYGYNNSAYRLLTNVYDPQNAHDAATKGYVDGIATMGILTTSPTGTTAGVPGRLYTYDTGGGSYEVYLCVHDNGDNTYIWKQVSLI